jgi:hypothetical protein
VSPSQPNSSFAYSPDATADMPSTGSDVIFAARSEELESPIF